MSPSAKFISVVLLLLAGGYGSSYLIDLGEPSYTTILSPIDDKFGKDYQPLFIDATHEKNDAWGEGSYKNRWLVDSKETGSENSLYDSFKNLEKGYSSVDSDKSLNQACKKAYEQTETDIKDTSKTHYEKNVGRYCSKGGAKPLVISATNQDVGNIADAIGKSKKDSLIATDYKYDSTNLWFWEIRNNEFYGLSGKNPTGATASSGSYFKKYYDDNKARYMGRQHVSHICEHAYKVKAATTSQESAPTEAEVLKFCSLKGKQ